MKKGLYLFLIGLIIFIATVLGKMYVTTNITQNHDTAAHETIQQTNNQAIGNLEIPPPSTLRDGWKLVWSDEFDDVSVTLEKWTLVDLVAEQNNELQYYSTNNIKISNGLLTLVAKEENARGRNYTSGAVNTKNTFNFLYGKVEMKAKLPVGQGIFPAFWMMTNKENTWLPEIDILEMVGHIPDEIWMVLHGLDDKNRKKTVSHMYTGQNFSNAFHTFGLEWSPTQLKWLIDGEVRFETSEYIPNEEMYLYINTAIGGNWPGSPDNTTQFPTLYEIDYVRIYQKDGEH